MSESSNLELILITPESPFSHHKEQKKRNFSKAKLSPYHRSTRIRNTSILDAEHDQLWLREGVDYQVHQQFGGVRIELPMETAPNQQLVIASSMPFPSLSSDSAVTDCPDNVVVPGAIVRLSEKLREGANHSIWIARFQQYGPEYAMAVDTLNDLVVAPSPRTPVEVTGA